MFSAYKAILKHIDHLSKEMISVAQYIGKNPELAFEEHKALLKLTQFLKKHHFNVKKEAGDLKTAFVAEIKNGNGPNIGFLAEYDALPGVGHACGHNLIGVASCAAAVALSKELKHLRGGVTVVGCPAEEGGGGKIILAKKGVLKNLTVAMMVHPDCRTEVVKRMLALIEIDIEFIGRKAHAAAEPHKGINALNSAVAAYQRILKYSASLKKDARVHGVFTSGGVKPNIIPDHAALKYYIRSLEMRDVNEIVKAIKNIALQEAAKIKAKVFFKINPLVYKPFDPNYTLASVFKKQLKFLQIRNEQGSETERIGSSDIGNVSQQIPALHPSIRIANNAFCHTPAFAKAALSLKGFQGMISGAKAMALTGYELFTKPEIVQKIQKEFKQKRQ